MRIAGKIQKVIEATETEKTPLSQKLDDFGEQLSKVTATSRLRVTPSRDAQRFQPPAGRTRASCLSRRHHWLPGLFRTNNQWHCCWAFVSKDKTNEKLPLCVKLCFS